MASTAFAFQQVPPAPGRGEGAPPASVEQVPSQAPAEGAQPAQPGVLGMLFPLLLFVPLLLLLFWSSRSQQKKQQAALAELKKGDRVLTQSGLIGKLVELSDRYAKIEIAPGVKVDVLKSGLVGKDTGDAVAEKKK